MTVIEHSLSHHDDAERLGVLCRWVRDNDLDPEDIVADSTAYIDGNELTVLTYVRNAKGGHIVVAPLGVATTTLTVPLLKPWPAEALGPR